MKRDFSAGGVVYKKTGNQLQFLLIKNFKKDKDVDYWGFPKGHLEKGETSKQAALRETLEETGVVAEIIDKIDSVKYFFIWDGEKVFKTVTFFLMKYISGTVKFQESELAAAEWFSQEDALDQVTYDNDKKLLKKALEMLDGQ